MRVTSDHGCAPATQTRGRVASQQQTDSGFANTLATALEASETDTDDRPPELSAATYRLFAAIDLARGDTKHAALHLARVPDAREAGLPLEPTGLLSDVGRWDYTEAAAALPETGRFDTATGQGERTFIPYNARPEAPAAEDCAPTEAATAETAETTIARLRNAAASTTTTRNERAPRVQLRDGIEELLTTVAS